MVSLLMLQQLCARAASPATVLSLSRRAAGTPVPSRGPHAAMRKKVDSRIRTLVENCVKTRQRSLFVIIGDKGRDQVVNLHYMLSKAVVKARPSVLWCYKKELHLSRCAAGRPRGGGVHAARPCGCCVRWLLACCGLLHMQQ